MPNLISSANFIGDVMLPNVAGTGAMATQLINFIAKYEPKYLKAIFGVEFYDLLIAGLAATDADYEGMRDRGTFVDRNGITRDWLGLKEIGESPIANYVYYQLMKYNVSQTQGVGESMSAVENGTRASSIPKMVEAWNQMVDWNYTLHEYMMAKYENEDLFPEYIGIENPPASYESILWRPLSEEPNQDLFRYINNFGI